MKALEKKLDDAEQWGQQETSRLRKVLAEMKANHKRTLDKQKAQNLALREEAEQYRLEAMQAKVSLIETNMGLR